MAAASVLARRTRATRPPGRRHPDHLPPQPQQPQQLPPPKCASAIGRRRRRRRRQRLGRSPAAAGRLPPSGSARPAPPPRPPRGPARPGHRRRPAALKSTRPRGDTGHLMRPERGAPQSEAIRAVVLEGSPCVVWGAPHRGSREGAWSRARLPPLPACCQGRNERHCLSVRRQWACKAKGGVFTAEQLHLRRRGGTQAG